VAKRITGMLRPFDTAARVGGDEFMILVDGIDDPDEPARMARRLEPILAEPGHIRGHDVVVTASVGVTVSGAGRREADDILRDAEVAIYSIKSGRRPTTR
jgi:diguanylate cyclase (GGDEF)-like protein